VLFFDTTSIYFEADSEDQDVPGEGEGADRAGLRRCGKSKDHRDDLRPSSSRSGWPARRPRGWTTGPRPGVSIRFDTNPGSGARAGRRPGSPPPARPAQHDDGEQPRLDLAISWLPARAAAALQLPDEEAPRQRHPPARRRNAALRELVLEMPPRIVADALGHSAQVTEKHAEDAGRTWVTYAPYRSRRGSIGGEPDTIQR
jgi:hypothetical protein